jgi:SAM-dependent methyltransferase
MEGSQVSTFGSDYAAAYDAMYQDKNYQAECDQLESCFSKYSTPLISSILDIGCGTGKHSWELAKRGYRVTGVDLSAQMLDLAANQPLESSEQNRPIFKHGDATTMDLKEEFDAVIMMFAVISYLNTNDSFIAGLRNVSRHLKPGGLFLADFWYGPGVLMDNPTNRTHTRSIGASTVERRVKPEVNLARNSCTLSYEVVTVDENSNERTSTEEHVMRYFFGPELDLALSITGFELLHLGKSMDWSESLQDADWTGSLVARRL